MTQNLHMSRKYSCVDNFIFLGWSSNFLQVSVKHYIFFILLESQKRLWKKINNNCGVREKDLALVSNANTDSWKMEHSSFLQNTEL